MSWRANDRTAAAGVKIPPGDWSLSIRAGRWRSFYFAFGDDDAYVICELPDNATAASIVLAVNSAGAANVNTVVLMTPEEVDEASSKSVDYRPPGKSGTCLPIQAGPNRLAGRTPFALDR